MSSGIKAEMFSLVHSACTARRLLGNTAFKLEQVSCGCVEVSLSLDTAEVFDHRGFVRGGVICQFVESVLQIAAVSTGVEAETLNFCCNIVKYAAADKLRVGCKICHRGRTTLVAETEVYDENDNLLATALTTLFVVATIKDIPRKW